MTRLPQAHVSSADIDPRRTDGDEINRSSQIGMHDASRNDVICHTGSKTLALRCDIHMHLTVLMILRRLRGHQLPPSMRQVPSMRQTAVLAPETAAATSASSCYATEVVQLATSLDAPALRRGEKYRPRSAPVAHP